MKALSCDWQATSLPPRRETTTLLVPTSIPTGCDPVRTRSSILSAASSGAFQRWSLFSAISLSSPCRALRLRREFLGCLRVRRQLGQPAVVAPGPLLALLVDAAPIRRRIHGEPVRRLLRPRPRLVHHRQEALVPGEAEPHRGRLHLVLVRQR